jgi:hypothetical protein
MYLTVILASKKLVICGIGEQGVHVRTLALRHYQLLENQGLDWGPAQLAPFVALVLPFSKLRFSVTSKRGLAFV